MLIKKKWFDFFYSFCKTNKPPKNKKIKPPKKHQKKTQKKKKKNKKRRKNNMSIVTMKKKAANRFSSLTKQSGKPPGGIFLSQGPFGNKSILAQQSPAFTPTGFSINGGTRNIGYVGRDSKVSKRGTPFRGIYPYGSGTYPSDKSGMTYASVAEPVMNVNEVIVLGDQARFIKPSVLSTYGMLRKKYRWIHSGQYPNYWVQPNYGSSMQSETKSQGNYLHDLTVANVRKIDVNNDATYKGHFKNCGGSTCHKTPVLFTFNNVASNAPYTKTLKQPVDCSIQTMRVQRRCANPIGLQKPFPFATNGQTQTCSIVNRTYRFPPLWYILSGNPCLLKKRKLIRQAIQDGKISIDDGWPISEADLDNWLDFYNLFRNNGEEDETGYYTEETNDTLNIYSDKENETDEEEDEDKFPFF